ncbi:UNKNOWN [Stylonychia lemnae]|uniref:Uncharacterized protein n=1 Tax=Stylonychia lemnae TaxID=5949 RepID=A0A078B4V5_STYLE|nr:UNKNOWN [Stylonychia lemnae]|eukprot:CDW88563.1 UNKNOWN [Stylonychia lemnae]
MGNSLEVCCLKNSNKNSISEPSRKNGKASNRCSRISKIDLQKNQQQFKQSGERNRLLSQSMVVDDHDGNLSLGGIQDQKEDEQALNMTQQVRNKSLDRNSLFDRGHVDSGSVIFKNYLDLAPKRQSNNLHDTNKSNKSSFFRDSFTDLSITSSHINRKESAFKGRQHSITVKTLKQSHSKRNSHGVEESRFGLNLGQGQSAKILMMT